MKKTLLLLLLLSFISNAQSKKNCDLILSKKINTDFNDIENIGQFRTNLQKLVGCGIDSLDIDIFSTGPIIASFLMDIATEKNKDSELTYDLLFKKILDFKKTESYLKVRNVTKVSKKLETRPASIENWDEDKLLLEQLEIPEQYISDFYAFLKKNPKTFQSYKDALISFSETVKEENTVSTDELMEFFKSPGNVDFDNLLKLSRENQKPILLYFTGYGCVNCRKMENKIFNIKPIFDILKNDFIFTSLYVDDKRKLPETDWVKSKINGKVIKTIGGKNSEFQVKRFNTNMQPFFVVLNSDNIILEKFQYTKIESDFLDFLNRGLNKK